MTGETLRRQPQPRPSRTHRRSDRTASIGVDAVHQSEVPARTWHASRSQRRESGSRCCRALQRRSPSTVPSCTGDASDSARPMHQFRSSSIGAIWLPLNCRLRVHRHTSVGKGRCARIDARSQLPSNCTVRHKVRRSSASTKSNGANCADKEVLPTRAARRSAVARPGISCLTCVLTGRRASIASNVSCGDQSLHVCRWPGDVGRHDTCNAGCRGQMIGTSTLARVVESRSWVRRCLHGGDEDFLRTKTGLPHAGCAAARWVRRPHLRGLSLGLARSSVVDSFRHD